MAGKGHKMKEENDMTERIAEIQRMIDDANAKFRKRAEDAKEQRRLEESE